MNEKTLFEQLRELDAKARQAEIWESKYKQLRENVIKLIHQLSDEMSINIIEKDIKLPTLKQTETKISNKKIYPLSEEIYKYLVETDKEITVEYIREQLEKNKLSTSGSYVTSVTYLLSKKEGISFRTIGNKRYYYYVKTSGSNPGVDFLKNMGKVIISG